MWLNKKLRLIHTEGGHAPGSMDDKWVAVQLKAGYSAKTFPPAEGQMVSVNFYKFIASTPNDPIGIYRIVANDTGKPDDSYIIGNYAPPELKIWRYERATQRLFFGTMATFTGTQQTQNQNTIETNFDLVLEDATPTTNGFAFNGGGYGKGKVLTKSWTEKPFKTKGETIYWETFFS